MQQDETDKTIESGEVPKGETVSATRHSSTGCEIKAQSLNREQVMNEVVTEWHQALEEKRLPHIKYGYVKREESWELRIYGRGLDALDRKEYKQNVVSLSLNYITLDHLILDDKFKRNLTEFNALTSINLSHNRLNKIDQDRFPQFWKLLSLLGQVCPNLKNLSIHHEEGNNDLLDVQCTNDEARQTYRAAVVSYIPQLENLDDHEVAPYERHLADVISMTHHPLPNLESLTDLSRVSQNKDYNASANDTASTSSLEMFESSFQSLIENYLREVWLELINGASSLDERV